MKRIIAGKIYNTETAKMMATWDNGEPETSIYYCAETMYRKKVGEYFLLRVGGAGSKYAQKSKDGQTMYGERIVPLTPAEADEWYSKHPESKGNDVQSDCNSKIKLCLSMTQAEANIIKGRADRCGLTISEYVVSQCTE